MRPFFPAAAALLLAGCAALPARDTAPPASFDLLGRLLAGAEGRAISAGFRWIHGTSRDEIWLMSPTGTTLAHISSDEAGATLTSADQQEYRAFSAESLIHRVLGWPLPLAELRHWVRAEPVPGLAAAAVERDAGGRLMRIEQAGWNVRYAYADAPGPALSPRRLDLERGGQRIRMVIDDRRIPDPQ